jgi:hypothetical protein
VHADSHFVIGSEHRRKGKPCQDYAAGESLPGGGAFAIISDGCSTGGETDNGSRVIVRSGVQAIKEYWSLHASVPSQRAVDWITLHQRMVFTAIRAMMGLRYSDMFATSAYAFASPDAGLAVVHGDGVVAWKYEDGRIGMIKYDWARNTPVYPVYAQDDFVEFIKLHGGDVTAMAATSESWEQSVKGGEFELLETREYTLGEAIQGFYIPMPTGSRFFGVFTDGVAQVLGRDWKDVVAELLDIRSVKGDFVKRQVIWLIREAEETGQIPGDDLAGAIIDLQGEETP